MLGIWHALLLGTLGAANYYYYYYCYYYYCYYHDYYLMSWLLLLSVSSFSFSLFLFLLCSLLLESIIFDRFAHSAEPTYWVVGGWVVLSVLFVFIAWVVLFVFFAFYGFSTWVVGSPTHPTKRATFQPTQWSNTTEPNQPINQFVGL